MSDSEPQNPPPEKPAETPPSPPLEPELPDLAPNLNLLEGSQRMGDVDVRKRLDELKGDQG